MESTNYVRWQEIAGRIHRDGCLAMSYITLGGMLLKKDVNPLALLSEHYEYLVEHQIMTEDCFVNNPEALLEKCLGAQFIVMKDYQNPQVGPVIAYNSSHFLIVDSYNRIIWNGLDSDERFKARPIHSYRVVKLRGAY